jgi:hypothetical protein
MDSSIADAERIVAKIRPLLAGNSPEIVGAVLMDLAATWLAGHHPKLRKLSLEIWLATLPRIVDANEKEIFGERGHPGRLDS